MRGGRLHLRKYPQIYPGLGHLGNKTRLLINQFRFRLPEDHSAWLDQGNLDSVIEPCL
jgi:hypothetical protein